MREGLVIDHSRAGAYLALKPEPTAWDRIKAKAGFQ